MTARRATIADVLSILTIAQEAYRDWPADWGYVAEWLTRNIERPEIFGCVAGGTFVVAMKQDWFWRPGVPEVTVLFIAGDGWGALACLRATVDWAYSLGAERLKVDAETGVNLEPLLRRVGIPFDRIPAFTMRLK